MKKALFIFTFLLFFFLTWSRAYGSEDILLIEVEKEEDYIKDDDNKEEVIKDNDNKEELIKEEEKQNEEYLNNTKASIALNNASYIYFVYGSTYYKWDVRSIEIGTHP